ncbi:zinc finger domain-containing protein [Thermomonospora cellulosilytica]|uniref:Integrase n=1 Tax=Thermomonospora cellulosilytica TaxID=1411118 RepID=A0A7W3N1Z6_9ACTN|nr:hypothetical protein [Thermomonospora cellulosilytica]MBA9006018.1 integrase [Thermomonospora cellulosilytica]
MAYTESRGKFYRGRYRNPPGVRPKWGTVSENLNGEPFFRKTDALRAAQNKEAEMHRLANEWQGPVPDPPVPFGEWLRMLQAQRRARGERDLTAGAITLQEWVETKWLPAQDLAVLSIRNYRQHLRNRILPTFGHRPLYTLTDFEEINLWEKQLRTRYMDNTVSNTRSLLTTLLNDARDAGLVDVNAAARRRRRGKVAEQRKGRTKKVREWLTPLQVLLLAERCAALTGRDDDFVMWITDAWCGLRWGELMAVRGDRIRDGKLIVDAQLIELDQRHLLSDPKDGSFRNDDPRFFGALDLPPFLEALLRRQIERRRRLECHCDGLCGAGRFLFLAQEGGHIRHRNYSEFPWRAACHGKAPESGPERPVLVDMAYGWPGVELKPAWRAVEGADWTPPRGRGQPRWDLPVIDAHVLPCPNRKCGARPGEECRSVNGLPKRQPHAGRLTAAVEQGHVRERRLATWLPIKAGLTPHGLRHSLRVWMDEDRIPEVAKLDRLGHSMPGIGGTYAHVSESMRQELVEKLQQRWETALRQRARMSATSTVAVLRDLLVSQTQISAPVRLPIVSQPAERTTDPRG